jgi:hypothetical protein
MARPKRVIDQPKKRRSPPAQTLEARENQLISLAVDLAEKQLSAGTASSQVITHYLKLGSTTEKLEREKLKEENELLKARAEAIRSEKDLRELYKKAMEKMSIYQGQDTGGDVEDVD